GEETARGIARERERRGPYTSLVDFLRRTPATLKRPAVENLVWVGAFEGLGLTRRELLWQAGLWLGPESDPRRTGGRDDHPQQELPLEDPHADRAFRNIDDGDRMVAEYRMLRFSTDLHPLSLLWDRLPRDTVPSERLPHLPQRSRVRVAGVVTARQRPSTAKGYVFVLMEDMYGQINVILKPGIYERYRSVVRLEPFLLVAGELRKDGASLNVVAREVIALREGAPVRSGTRPGPRPGAEAESAASPHPGAPEGAPDPPDPFRYLTALRQHSPDAKSWG
ncbi:MAG: hypothetical protein RQ751_10310, partial [Longimicrobiales bacterium]|nr:hypothetical protein [Longimicrobiales bacterium]